MSVTTFWRTSTLPWVWFRLANRLVRYTTRLQKLCAARRLCVGFVRRWKNGASSWRRNHLRNSTHFRFYRTEQHRGAGTGSDSYGTYLDRHQWKPTAVARDDQCDDAEFCARAN